MNFAKITKQRHPAALFLCLLLLNGCASQENQVKHLVHKHGLSTQIIETEIFAHKIISSVGQISSYDMLHVYIEGDGLPWIRKNLIAADPTPRNPLALKLMVQDKVPSIYLGRPCYMGLASTKNCAPPIWTNRRYSLEVLNSMQAALEQYLKLNPYKKITFIGYSGGGVLAMLLAERFTQTNKLLTIAANLDIDAWSRHHNYSALAGSLNPSERPPLSGAIMQTHFAGKRDTNVPVALIKFVSSKQHNATVRIMEKFDHVCCWEKEWPYILKTLK